MSAPPILDPEERYKHTRRVTVVGSVVDIVLTVTKVTVGMAVNSQALVADGIHSLSDFASGALVWIAARQARHGADNEHPYGHGRFETIATVGLGLAMIGIGIGLAWDGIEHMRHPETLHTPGMLAFVVAAASVGLKEWVYRYTLHWARLLRSDLLRASAWHSRSDAISSIVVLVGLLGVIVGLPYLDAAAAVGVAYLIAKIGWNQCRSAIQELVDTALDQTQVEKIRQEIIAVAGVRDLHLLRTRRMGSQALVDVHVQVEPFLSVSEGHQIGEAVRDRLLTMFDEVTDVLVHVDAEDDMTSAACAHLPLRTELVGEIQNRWQAIPQASHIKDITLHYLAGSIHVEILLPVTALQDLSELDKLCLRFQEAVSDMPFHLIVALRIG